MGTVRVRYHLDEGAWWADAPELPGWSAAGDTFSEVRAMARQGAEVFAGLGTVVVEEGVPDQESLDQAQGGPLVATLNTATPVAIEGVARIWTASTYGPEVGVDVEFPPLEDDDLIAAG
jgi:predicted RNase H-like HicB family nuclease